MLRMACLHPERVGAASEAATPEGERIATDTYTTVLSSLAQIVPRILAWHNSGAAPVLTFIRSGEQAASALEANLTNLEGRLDALLAAFESAQEPNEDGTVAPPPGQDAKKPDDTVPAKTSNGGTQSSESKSPEAAKKA
ncbi:hypothetical protein CSIM01_12114 [Colletotrichum simmondsii]|uniref:Uncharacterized protein n=1 Tax=Colletotrichum simmondsii TaxID=703756 RepID=A0A135TSB9_9PEZI|nr:hypothetical protein CSIM01_12114 [Colletotrichum simmondsii]